MTNVQKFMLITGKYYPEENIKLYIDTYYFERFDSNNNRTYYECSLGYWAKFLRDSKDNTYYEDSKGYWYKATPNGNVIESGNYYDK